MKSNLEIRPVYHYKPAHIEGHFLVCFLAFLMERKMEMLLKEIIPEGAEDDVEKASCNKIQKALNSMQLTAVTTTQGEKFIKAKVHPLASKIFNTLKLKMPDNISTKDELLQRLHLSHRAEFIQLAIL